MPTPPLFELRNMSYSYIPQLPIFTDINLQIAEGESVVILGANGCGKSTLLKILGGLVPATSGQVFALGQELTADRMQDQAFLTELRQQVGFVFQNSDSQLFSATVRDEIAFAPLQAGLSLSEASQRVEETANLLGIGHLVDRPPYKLSGGEKKKVALASVLSVNPKVLLLDEPTNGLDPRTQFWLVELLAALQKVGKTVITATHDLSIVEEIAQRAIIFREGHSLAADGKPLELLANRSLLLDVNLIHERSHFHVGGNRQHA